MSATAAGYSPWDEAVAGQGARRLGPSTPMEGLRMHKVSHDPQAEQALLSVAYGGRLAERALPKNRLPDGQHVPGRRVPVRPRRAAAGRQLPPEPGDVRDDVDGAARPTRLMAETFDKNMIDKDEYPQTAEIERRCVNIVADLFHAPSRTRRGRASRRSARARPSCSPGSR